MPPLTCHEGEPEFFPLPTPETHLNPLKLIPVSLPPNLLSVLGVKPTTQYVCLTYQNRNCYVETATAAYTDSFWIYDAFIKHFAVAIHLLACHLGSDDSYPTDGILIDQLAEKIWIAPYQKIRQFLRNWHFYSYPPIPITHEQRQQFYEAVVPGMQSIPRLSREERSALIQQSRMKEIAAIAAIQQSLGTQLTSAVFFAISLREKLQKSGQNF